MWRLLLVWRRVSCSVGDWLDKVSRLEFREGLIGILPVDNGDQKIEGIDLIVQKNCVIVHGLFLPQHRHLTSSTRVPNFPSLQLCKPFVKDPYQGLTSVQRDRQVHCELPVFGGMYRALRPPLAYLN